MVVQMEAMVHSLRQDYQLEAMEGFRFPKVAVSARLECPDLKPSSHLLWSLFRSHMDLE